MIPEPLQSRWIIIMSRRLGPVYIALVMPPLNDIPEHLQQRRTERFAWLHSPLVPTVIFVLPGVLLLAGGTSAAPYQPQIGAGIGDFAGALLHPDDWPTLLVCSVLICLPGWLFYIGADFLAELTFAHLLPLNSTPAVFWRVTGYLVAILAACAAAGRLWAA
jgi:hypothetical protein